MTDMPDAPGATSRAGAQGIANVRKGSSSRDDRVDRRAVVDGEASAAGDLELS